MVINKIVKLGNNFVSFKSQYRLLVFKSINNLKLQLKTIILASQLSIVVEQFLITIK